jgi:hypothetical protein
MVRHYCIEREADHELLDVEAAYFERDGDEWVFYVGLEEVFRISVDTVVGISKAA